MSQTATQRFPVCLEGKNGSGSTIAAFLAVEGGRSAITIPNAITDPVYGITTQDILDGTFGDVQVGGVAIATAGTGGVTEGQRLTVEANTGKLIPWNPAGGANQTIVGLCLLTAAADKLTEVLLGAGALGQG